MNIHPLVDTLTYQLIGRPDFADIIQVMGIDPKDWPDGRTKTMAQTYLALREQHNHDYAAHILAKDAIKLKPDQEIPLEPNALTVYYRDALREFRVKRFADRLSLSDSRHYDSLLSEFFVQQTTGIEVFNFGDQIKRLAAATVDAAAEGRGKVTIAGWPLLSWRIGGFNPGRLTLLVAETGFGKTNAAQALARAASQTGSVLFVNMEMMADDLGDKFLLGATGMSFDDYKTGKLNFEAIQQAEKEFSTKRLLYTGGRPLSVRDIYSLVRREKAGEGLFMVFVDYDQKISIQTSRDVQEWKALQMVVSQLEDLAKEAQIHVMLLAQANAEGDPSGSKRSKYGASTVLRFYKDKGQFLLRAVKNRFGQKDAAVVVKYDPSRATLAETNEVPVDKESFSDGGILP